MNKSQLIVTPHNGFARDSVACCTARGWKGLCVVVVMCEITCSESKCSATMEATVLQLLLRPRPRQCGVRHGVV